MICKKCGRKYEDDMPKCLWCDAPNEGYISPREAAAKNSIQLEKYDIAEHSRRTIFWLKFFFSTNLIFSIYFIGISFTQKNPISDLEFVISQTGLQYIAGALLYAWCVSLFSIFTLHFSNPPIILSSFHVVLLSIQFCFCIYKCAVWIFYVEEEQSRFSKTNFSPDKSMLMPLIPFIGPIFLYLIFKDILTKQKEVLEKNNLECKNIPIQHLQAFAISCFVMQVGFLVVHKPIIWFASVASSYIFLALYIKIIKIISANIVSQQSLYPDDSPQENL